MMSALKLVRAPSAGRVATPALEAVPTGALQIADFAPEPDAHIKLSLVIPTFNERNNLPVLIERLTALLEPKLGAGYELIIVDDDSPDRTWELALEIAAQDSRVRVMRREGEKGLSTAVIRGWQIARGEILGVMDADLQHPPEVNLALLEEMAKGADLAVGSRHVEGGGVSDWSMIRRVLSRGAQLLALVMLPAVISRINDPMSGLFMVRRTALGGVKLDPLGYKILIEVLARGQVRWIGEVGYVFRERVDGESKVTWRLYVQYLRHLLRLRLSTLPESRFFRFCVVGGTGVFVDMLMLYLMSDPAMLGLGLTRSKLIAAETAIISNFMLNDRWTFRDVSRADSSWKPKIRRFLGFNIICSTGLLLNLALLNLLFNFGGLNRYIANAISILAVTLWNYGLNRKLNWAPLVTSRRG